MNANPYLVMGALVLVFATAVVLGLIIHRVEARVDRRDEVHGGAIEEAGLGNALGFIGGSAAFLLGVLMLTSISYFHDTENIADEEALAYSAAFDSTLGLAPADQPPIRRDLICLMRTVATDSWDSTRNNDLTGDENTQAWLVRTFKDANAIAPQTPAQQDSLGSLQSELIEAAKSGQHRLLRADGNLPGAMWILVFVGVFALTLVVTVALRTYPLLGALALAGILTLSGSMLWALTSFSEPFTTGDGVFISPRAVEAVMTRLQDTYPDANWAPCERLAKSELG